jgi:hypothetical protein
LCELRWPFDERRALHSSRTMRELSHYSLTEGAASGAAFQPANAAVSVCFRETRNGPLTIGREISLRRRSPGRNTWRGGRSAASSDLATRQPLLCLAEHRVLRGLTLVGATFIHVNSRCRSEHRIRSARQAPFERGLHANHNHARRHGDFLQRLGCGSAHRVQPWLAVVSRRLGHPVAFFPGSRLSGDRS